VYLKRVRLRAVDSFIVDSSRRVVEGNDADARGASVIAHKPDSSPERKGFPVRRASNVVGRGTAREFAALLNRRCRLISTDWCTTRGASRLRVESLSSAPAALPSRAAISRLTLAHVQTSAGTVRLRLGCEPVVLPEPVAGLVLELAARRRGHAALGDQGTSPWLFPGGRPGHPISSARMTERLRQLGVQSGQSRSTALFQLATDLPAAILARMLGIHISVAVAWQRASSGDWMTYAADVSRRNEVRKDDDGRETRARGDATVGR
jgi:hypothetical protein